MHIMVGSGTWNRRAPTSIVPGPAAWDAFYELTLSADDPDLSEQAERAIYRAISIRRPDSQAEIDHRAADDGGLVCLGPHRLLAAEIPGGQLAGIRIGSATLRHRTGL
jgi:hypothetical protein